jgi:hypothetical protein
LVIGLITAGLLSFAAFILLLGWGKPEGDTGQLSGSAPSVAAVGFAGIAELSGEFFPTRMVEKDRDLDSYELLVVALTPPRRARAGGGAAAPARGPIDRADPAQMGSGPRPRQAQLGAGARGRGWRTLPTG